MATIAELRELYESYAGTPDRPQPRGRTAFVTDWRHRLGLCDRHGNNYKDRAGNRILKESKIGPLQHDAADLGLALVGPRVLELFGSGGNQQLLADYARHNMLVGERSADDGRALYEAAGVGVDVSAFANINAWTGTVGGLIERKILEQFQNPEFIGDELMPAEPTKVNEGQKVIGVSRIGDLTEERQPGAPHKRAGFGERYVTLGKMRENALAIDVFRETEFYDLTGQVMPTAVSVGEWVSFRQEIEKIDAYIGVSTQSAGKFRFQYKGTAYDTYSASQTIGSSTFTNSQTNELVDWQSVETAWLLSQRMVDPETGTRIGVRFDRCVVNPGKLATADIIFGASEHERRSAPTTTQATATDLRIVRGAGNVVSRFFGNIKLLWSALLEQRCTDAASGIARPGLGLTQDQATKRWWLHQRDKFMKWMQAFPLTVTQAPANSYEMVDRGIVLSVFTSERGFPGVYSIWHGQQNTH